MRSFPKRLKYKKYHKLKLKNIHKFKLDKTKVFGKIGVQVLNQKELRPEQIETGRVAIKRMIKEKKKTWTIWVRLFTYSPITKKSQGLRMGKGKGSIKRWVCPIHYGNIIYEINHKKVKGYKLLYFKGFGKVWRKLPLDSKIRFNIY